MSLQEHLRSGATTVARAWALTRRDGVTLGFTDHDRDLTFEAILFRASSGMTARALQQTTGLAVDNTEASGALSHDAISAEDIAAGRYDGAEVRIWLVNWTNPEDRRLEFRGSLGDVVRSGAAFRAELRGLSEALMRPGGRLIQRGCTASLGDERCRVDLSLPDRTVERVVKEVTDNEALTFAALDEVPVGWFTRGSLRVRTGLAQGLRAAIKADRQLDDGRRSIILWQRLGADLAPGDLVEIVVGCDKQPETCRERFANILNFQGFPYVPGEDWLMAVPRSGALNDGGSLRR
jgi:uncharacterized phage protein (TIGR02218 family)